jgi:hypothetical protein
MLLSIFLMLISQSQAANSDYYAVRASTGCRVALEQMRRVANKNADFNSMFNALKSFKPMVGGADCPNEYNYFRSGAELHICHEMLNNPSQARDVCLFAAAMATTSDGPKVEKLVDDAEAAIRKSSTSSANSAATQRRADD